MPQANPQRSWGLDVSQASYNADLQCRCGWDWSKIGISKMVRHVVGFSTNVPFESTRKTVGAVVVECPECFEKFWFHASEMIVDKGQQLCPKWPKT